MIIDEVAHPEMWLKANPNLGKTVSYDAYLEHVGVKGMKWGVRKSQNHPDVGNSKRSRRGGTPEQRRAGTKKIARNLAIGAGVGVVGGLAVGALIKRSGAIPVRQVAPKFVSSGRDFTIQSSNSKMGMDMHTLMTKVMQPTPQGPIGSTSAARLGGAIPMPKVRG